MNAILHGTWITNPDKTGEGQFFLWAERAARLIPPAERAPRIRRHPYAATTIELAELLSFYLPHTDWRSAARLTRVVLLPSRKDAPLVPRWLREEETEEDTEEAPYLKPWRVEGIGLPVLQILDLLAALPRANHGGPTLHRLGDDLRYWGLVAKFALELLARQRFLPGLRSADGTVRALWLPVLDEPQDRARWTALVGGMPPVCRALLHERGNLSPDQVPSAETILQSFLEHLLDNAVREWSRRPGQGEMAGPSDLDRGSASLAAAWWQALTGPDRVVRVPSGQQKALTQFYQAWQNWHYRAQPAGEAAFRLCFRLEPPEFDQTSGRVISPNWTLRYFLQALDDPSLLVPAEVVWRERGNVLSYLNHLFDHPQEKLLAGLGLAARLSPAIQRSLKAECPEAATLTAQEAYAFLRETARLLEGLGFGVLVPPWWNKPDARLRVRAKLHASPEVVRSGILSMDSLVAYDWELALGDEILTREEFERLAALKAPLVQVRGRWVLLQPEQVEAAIAFWEKRQAEKQLPLRDALSLALGAQDEMDGLPLEVTLDDWFAELLRALERQDQVEILPTPQGFVGQLRPYQVRGFSWLAFMRRWGLGACLADDMGLGKTIQAIALLLHERAGNPHPAPSLLICPTSVVGNWRREVERFAPSLKVLVHHGASRAEGSDFVQQSLQSDLVISTYGLARRDIDDLLRVRWSNIILDEAQNIKNPATKQARAIRRLVGEYRLALTGTPVENRLAELWSIMAFLNPGYLGSLESFRRTFAVPIERYQDRAASEQLRKLVRPFILRRLKTDPQVIQDLPEKFEYRVFCNLTREQATLYEAIETLERSRHAFRSREMGQLRQRLTRLLEDLAGAA